MPFRVAIVNDLAMAREALRRVVGSMPGVVVAWMAADGAEAIANTAKDRPDLVLMDLIMPGVDGVDATRTIMRQSPCPIVVVTATVEGNASRVYEAIGAGALDAVDTPRLATTGAQGAQALIAKIEEVRRMRAGDAPPVRGSACAASPIAAAADQLAAASKSTPLPPIVAVGSSTGGPQALATMLQGLPNPAPFAIVIVQHMEPTFLPGLVSWLASQTGRDVRLAKEGVRPQPNTVTIAGEDRQLVTTASGTLCYCEGPVELIHRPSVDMLFESLAASDVPPGVAVLLTGMGKDGASGMASLRAKGWETLAQDQASSVVWGMPGAAVESGAAMRAVPIKEMGPAITEAIARRRAQKGGAR